MTEQVDMSRFIEAKSDQLNADDLMDSPKTIKIIKVTASPDSAEQPVSVHYEGGQGKVFKPCKTVRRIMVGVWGPDASKYVGRSMTLYRDPTVSFGGMQVGGIRVSHMSHIEADKTVALLVTRGRKAPFKVKPLVTAPAQSEPSDFSEQLAELKAIATPGNLDALGAKWQEIGADARKALAAELPALKAACEVKAEADVPFSDEPTAADVSLAKAIDEMKHAESAEDLETIIKGTERHRIGLTDDQLIKLDIAISHERQRFETADAK